VTEALLEALNNYSAFLRDKTEKENPSPEYCFDHGGSAANRAAKLI